MQFLIILIVLLITTAWILAGIEVKAERRTFDFIKKHFHKNKHRKEEYYLDDDDFDDYYGSHHSYKGRHYPTIHIHVPPLHRYGIGESKFHGGYVQQHGIPYHSSYPEGAVGAGSNFISGHDLNEVHDDYGNVNEYHHGK